MKAFDFVAARDLDQALALLAEHGKAAKLLAGGTDLIVELRAGAHAAEVVVDITRVAALKVMTLADDGLHIGALVTHSELMRAPMMCEHFPALIDAAHTIGAVQTRNLGTLVGNLISCVPSMDSGPTLLALDAEVGIASMRGRIRKPLADLFVGPRKTCLAADEMVTEVFIPRASVGKPAGFQKFGLRKGQALALVNVGASFWIDEKTYTFREPRIALGAVAPTVIRARKAEDYLAGKPISVEAMAEAGRIAATEAKPITDFRASADYRRDLIETLTRRALEIAGNRANPQRQEAVA